MIKQIPISIPKIKIIKEKEYDVEAIPKEKE